MFDRKPKSDSRRADIATFIFENSPDAYLVLENGVIADCNMAMETLMGCGRESIVGISPGLISPEFQPCGGRSTNLAIGTDLSLYDAVVLYLAGAFRLLRLDTRGHGLSDAPDGDYDLERLARDVLDVMDAAEVETAVLCGVSLGGMMAMRAALLSPQRVDGLVLACTSAAMDRAAWQARVQAVRAQGMGAIVDLAIGRFVSEVYRVANPEGVRRLR
jgi:PAS domain-containing protein